MNLLTFDNPDFRYYAIAAALMIVKMMSQGWITVFRMLTVKGGYRYPEDAQRSLANHHPNPEQLLPNEYVERSRRMHGNDVENIPLFLVSGLLYVCTAPNNVTALCVFTIYVLSRFAHFYVVLTAWPHEVRALFWTVGSLGRVDSFDPEPCCCDRQHREVGSGGFFVAGRDAAKLFEPIDTALDEIAPLIRFPIIFNRCLAIGLRRDNGLDASVHQIVANFVAVVALVAEESVRIHIVKFHQRIIAFDLVHLVAGDIESQRVAFGVRAEVDFGREAAARAAERFLILIPPFTPAACWCARTIVEFMACSVSAAGPRLASVSKAASQTPSLLQRVKRMKTEFQFPYRSGMSRQGAPVRKTQRMPLTVRRLSGIAGPRSPRSGSNGSRMRHSESVRSPQLNAASSRKAALNQNSIPLSKTVNTA